MNRKEFINEILKPRLKSIEDTLASKADEYATDGSAFYNFERSAEINRSTPKKELWGMASKHFVSVIDMIESDTSYSEEYIEEKVGDLINYLILLEGILKIDSYKDWRGSYEEFAHSLLKGMEKPTKEIM